MKCPTCNEEIEEVRVYSQCYQKCKVDEKGLIIDWGPVEEVLDTQGIECSNCASEVINIIEQG